MTLTLTFPLVTPDADAPKPPLSAALADIGQRCPGNCLPALHNRDTQLGEELFIATGRTGPDVTENVFETSASIVFDQAENQLHTTKAIMVATVARKT